MATHAQQVDYLPASEPVMQSTPPPLESGDVLTRPEFERRYEAMPWVKKAELIDGVVYVGSPVSDAHAVAHAMVTGLLINYAAQTPGTSCGDNGTVRLDLGNEFQPDVLLRIEARGQSRVEKYIEGPPELVAEVALSSASRDLHSKFDVYRRHGVREYLVWRVMENEFDWFVLEEGDYRRVAPDAQGVFRSREFPGLWLDQAALLKGDMAAALARLNEGLASSDHAEFVARLAARK